MPGLFVRRLAVSLVPLLLLAGCTEGTTPVATPDPTSTSTPVVTESPEAPSPAEIVDDPASQLVEVQSVPGDRNRRVSLWRRCQGTRCVSQELAVAVTDDGFRTRTVADATWRNATVRLSDDGQAVVIDYRTRLRIDVVGPDGRVTPVERSDDVAPLAEGEVFGGVSHRRSETVFWATDAVGARAHPVPAPTGAYQLVQTDRGQLRALTVQQTYLWSDDGGATWQESSGAGEAHGPMLAGFVASADDTHVVVRGGDGATLFPFEQIRRLDSPDSWTVTEVSDDPMAYVGPTGFLPDGRFLASVQSWSDNNLPGKKLKGTPPGIYVSVGGDWSTYERIESGPPFDTPAVFQPMVTDIDVTADGALITAIGPDQTTAWTSRDRGATWLEMRVR